jgi:opacity protein-like surface antigen
MVRSSILFGWLAVGMAFAAPDEALGQGGDGFLFEEPRVTIAFRMGYDAPLGPRFAGGQSDIFGFTQELLTVSNTDFDALSLGGEVGLRASSRFDVVFDIYHASSSTFSEFQDWVDLDDLPIQQTTEFSRTSFALSGRYFLTDRGVNVSQFAWVPKSWSPYVGAGAGFLNYRYTQDGDFVDFETLDIFSARLDSEGTSFLAQGMAGIQYSFAPNWILTGEARYRWASAELESDYVGFEDIDLTGLQATFGIGVRF